MFTLVQQGENEQDMFWAVEYNGNVVDYYTSSEAASLAIEQLKHEMEELCLSYSRQ